MSSVWAKSVGSAAIRLEKTDDLDLDVLEAAVAIGQEQMV